MSLNDTLANALSHLMNCEKNAKPEAMLSPSTKMLKNVLEIMKNNGYVGEFTEIQDGRGNVLKVNMLGKINNCGVIKPRFTLNIKEYEKFEKRFLPAKGFGIIFVSTNKGVLTHEEAKKQNLGGKLIAYVY